MLDNMVNDNLDSVPIFLYYIFFAFIAFIYVIPSIVGTRRAVTGSWLLFILNLTMGWTGLIWVACIIWAVTGRTKYEDSYYRQLYLASKKAG